MFLKTKTYKSTENYLDKLKEAIQKADAIVIGAGAGLSTAAGFTYSGNRFKKYFSDFKKTYNIQDMYSGGFYPFPNLETYWTWWARHIYVNRYMDPDKDTYQNLLKLVQDKDYFVITTNVDHMFQKSGFDKNRLFYMQGDYGLWQCVDPCHQETYDNEEQVKEMLVATGFLKEIDGKYEITDPSNWKMEIPSELIPYCPHCQQPMVMNLRCDDTFVQDEGWYAAKARYESFIKDHQEGKVLYLELGVGMNTPVWIKYPFWQMTAKNKEATYACLNYGEAYAPREISKQSICVDTDTDQVLEKLIKE